MTVSLLLLLFTASKCSSAVIEGETGQNITLPCKYDVKYYGPLSVCWNRGALSFRGCSNELVSTDGVRVTKRVSSRYQLLGRLDKGDVSLTILNITEADAGRYGCRVEIPGWFNDEKHHFDLTVVPQRTVSPSSPSPSSSSSSSSAPATTETDGHMTPTSTPLTESLDGPGSEQRGWRLAVVLVIILSGLSFLVAAVMMPDCEAVVTTETVAAMLPCRSARGVEVRCGTGEPPPFSCRSAVTYSAGSPLTHRKSHRDTSLS